MNLYELCYFSVSSGLVNHFFKYKYSASLTLLLGYILADLMHIMQN